jgi:hypothetical protein
MPKAFKQSHNFQIMKTELNNRGALKLDVLANFEITIELLLERRGEHSVDAIVYKLYIQPKKR